MEDLTLSLRNIARYVRDVDANVPLYQAPSSGRRAT